MNISGVIVKTAPENLDRVRATLAASGLCEVHFHDASGKIVVTVEGEDSQEEIGKVRAIMNLPHVLCADLAYSCGEDDAEKVLEHLAQTVCTVPNALRHELSPDTGHQA